jgi:hypothetical protein
VTRFRLKRRRAVVLALSASVFAVAAPTAVAAPVEQWHQSEPAAVPPPPSQMAAGADKAYQDLRSPDARDAAAASVQQAQSSGDLRSPDARDAALASQQAPSEVAYRDLRSPDARDAALASQQARSEVASTDLRSPDARDAALASTTGSQPAPAAAPVETRTVLAVDDSGSQTLAIVFSSIALVLALLAIGFAALWRRPRPRWTAP